MRVSSRLTSLVCISQRRSSNHHARCSSAWRSLGVKLHQPGRRIADHEPLIRRRCRPDETTRPA